MMLTQFIGDTNIVIDDLDIIYHKPHGEDDTAGLQVLATANGKTYCCVMKAREEVREDIAVILDNELATMKNLGVEDNGVFNQLTGEYLASRILSRFPDMTHGQMVCPNKKEFSGEETVYLINLALSKICTDICLDAYKRTIGREKTIENIEIDENGGPNG